jgi:hypothetical protein
LVERIKYNAYKKKLKNYYFWRTYDQQDDLIEEGSGALNAYEFKWNAQKKMKAPGGWTNAYLEASF